MMRARMMLRRYLGTLLGVIFVGILYVGLAAQHVQSANVTVTVTALSSTTFTIGSTLQFKAVAKNTSGGTLSYTEKFYINSPSGKRIQVPPGIPMAAISNNLSVNKTSAVTTSIYNQETGAFTFEADAVDSTGNVLATGTFSFTVLPLPTGLVAPTFTDVAPALGVNVIHHIDKKDCMVMMGTGAGWADYDHSGFPSLFVSDYNGQSHLFHNNLGTAGTLSFTDMTSAAFPGISMTLTHASGVSWADYDNDGYPDLLVVGTDGMDGMPVNTHLFHNNGNGTFTDVTMTAFSGEMWMDMMGDGLRATTGAWGDYDNDGFVDLYITNYMGCMMPAGMPMMGQPDQLFHNNGNGTFTDMTSLLGGTTAAAVTGLGFSGTWFDYNGDGLADLYVVNDQGAKVEPNVLWQNGGMGSSGWTFNNVSSTSGANLKMSAMGIGVLDYNNDGNPDIAVTNIGSMALLKNNGNGTFTNVAQSAGSERQGILNSAGTGYTLNVTWGIAGADLNDDGYEDIVAGGGAMGSTATTANMPNAVLVNNYNNHLTGVSNDGTFLDLTYLSGMGNLHTSPTIAVGDFDGDGYMDVAEVNWNTEALNLYRNESPVNGNTNNWLEVRLMGVGLTPVGGLPHGSNGMGIGAKVSISACSANQYRQIISGTSLGAGNEVIAHFGLGTCGTVDTLTVTWPSGLVQTFSAISTNQRLVITEGSSTLGNDPVPVRTPL